MSDYYPVDSSELKKQGTRGVLSTGAGLAVWIVNGLLHVPVIGIVLGGALTVLGVLGLLGRNKADKETSIVLMAAGGAGLASLILPGLSSVLLGIGGLALVGYGAVNLFKFIKGLRSRS